MKAFFTKSFKKNYKKRIHGNKNLENRFEDRYDLFINNQSDEILKEHQLSGKLKGFRSFSITGDIRVIYYIHDNTAYLVDIGTHNQVYKK